MCAAALQASITVLAQPCLLAHIPRSRLPKLSHHVTKHLLAHKPAFLNITSNDIEVSIFASAPSLQELATVARRDARRARRSKKPFDPVQVSEETWHVLLVEAHEDYAEDTGARVRQISAPLAKAGISIMYQTSYMSDYILVRSDRLNEAVTLLGSAGFGFYSTNPVHLTSYISSPPSCSSPGTPSEQSPNLRGSLIFDGDPLAELTSSPRVNPLLAACGRPCLSQSPCRSRSASYSNAPPTNLDAVSLRISALSLSLPPPPNTFSSSIDTQEIDLPATDSLSLAQSLSPSSPPIAPVTLLPSDLAMVGLSEETSDIWTSKLIKLLIYPELIQPLPKSSSSSEYLDSESLFQDYRNSLENLVLDPGSPDQESDGSSSSSSSYSSSCSSDGGSDVDESDNDEVAFVDAPAYPIPPSPATNDIDLTSSAPTSIPPSPAFRIQTNNQSYPFFGLTRTNDGTSLTADVHQLATLFTKEERYMLLCADEFDWVDEDDEDELEPEPRLARTWPVSKVVAGSDNTRTPVQERGEPGWQSKEQESDSSILRCLQIDLRAFDLDKHGLVNRFSDILNYHGINHQYSSAFKTANILVSRPDAPRVLSFFNAC